MYPAAALTDRHYQLDRVDADWRFDRVETTLSHLLREAHPALAGRAYGPALLDGLDARELGPGEAGGVWEIGGGAGWLMASCEAGRPELQWTALDVSRAALSAQRTRLPAGRFLRADCRSLPLADGAVTGLLLANEVIADLPADPEAGKNTGALAFVDEVARVLAPAGQGRAALIEFGSPDPDAGVEGVPMWGDDLAGGGDHTEWTIRFADLIDRARSAGLQAECVPLFDLLDVDRTVRVASYLDLRRLQAAGGDCPTIARTAEEIRRRHPVLTRLFEFEFPEIGSPRWPDPGAPVGAADAFWALLLRTT